MIEYVYIYIYIYMYGFCLGLVDGYVCHKGCIKLHVCGGGVAIGCLPGGAWHLLPGHCLPGLDPASIARASTGKFSD